MFKTRLAQQDAVLDRSDSRTDQLVFQVGRQAARHPKRSQERLSWRAY